MERSAGPEIQIVNILCRAALPAIAGHDLLADHLVRIKSVHRRCRELDAGEVLLTNQGEGTSVEDGVQAIGDLQLENASAVVVLVGNGSTEVLRVVVRPTRLCEGEVDSVKWAEIDEGRLSLRLESIASRSIEVDVL